MPDIDMDLAPSKRELIFEKIREERGPLGCVQVCTFSTESTKSAILSAFKGYRSREYPEGIDNDTAQYFASLVPVERGFVWSVHDVVYGDDETMKYKEDETNIYGRGAIDMKGQVAVILSLIKNNTFNTKYAVFITSDEEIDGNCCKELMKIYNSKLAIVPDGGNNFELIEEEKGLIQLKLTANTISAHASTPFDGENAILKLLNVYNKLIKKYSLPVSEEDYKTSINLSKINGGDSINKVPDNATMYLDIRYTSDVTLEGILSLINKIDSNIDVSVVTEGILFKTDINNKLIKKYIQTCEEVLNRKIVVKKVTSTSDGIYFSEKNIPTIIMNPSGGNAHSQNEYVNIDSLKKLYEIYEKFIKKEEII